MLTATCTRKDNTVRIQIPPTIRNALDLVPGSTILFHHTAPGVVEIRNGDKVITAGMQALES